MFHSNPNEIIFFSGFLLFVFLMLAVDLGFFNKHSHKQSFRSALFWTMTWVAISILFYFLIRNYGNLIHGTDTLAEIQARINLYKHPISIAGITNVDEAISIYNKNLSLEYFTGYLIEYSLSVDNIFVIIMIFLSFKIRQENYKRILLWGILGAIIMRFIFIFAASAIIQRFAWSLLIFGGLLVVVGIKMGYEFFSKKDEDQIDTEHHPVVRFLSKFFAISHDDHGESFFVRINRKLYITHMFIVLVIIEFSDVIFAIDSVPAVFSVTQDPYIVFFSNIFAILGLRSLFFLVMDVMNRFHFLKLGLGVLLTFVGVKMLIHDWVNIDTRMSLYIISGILVASILASMVYNRKKGIVS
jgi:tellurite resistance protein TerC